MDERVAEYLKANPQVADAIKNWAESSVSYEDALKPFLLMPVSYSSTSSVDCATFDRLTTQRYEVRCRPPRGVGF
jgi:hypothetical protein